MLAKLRWMQPAAHLAERTALSVDRRVRRGAAGVAVRGARGPSLPRAGANASSRRSSACSVARAALRIGEAPDRDGQYFHYLAMWLYALAVLGAHRAGIPRAARSQLARDSARCVRRPGPWRVVEDARGPERRRTRASGFGALDAFDGYVSYRLLDEAALTPQIDGHAPPDRARRPGTRDHTRTSASA